MRLPLLLLALALSCSGEEPGTPEGAADHAAPTVQPNPHRFEVWHADFPFAVHVSPSGQDDAYHYSAAEALERVVAKLQGNCTPEGWRMAMQFFGRAPESAIPVLIAALDRALPVGHLADVAQNTVEALGYMGRYGSPEVAAAILRTLRHGKTSVQNSAMGALVPAGTPEAVRAARASLPGMHLRGQASWVRAVRTHLPEEEIVEIYGELLRSDGAERLFGTVVEEATKLPTPLAARVLAPLWEGSRNQLRLTVAGVLHAAGDLRGTRHLREVLEQGSADAKAAAVFAAARGDLEYLRDDILKLSLDPGPTVRQAVALTIGGMPGENVDNILATLAVDPADDARRTALTMLRGRGRREMLDRLIERVRTDSGTKLVEALGDLSAAGDGQAVAPILERMRGAPHEEWQKFLQALGLSRTVEGFGALKQVFLEPEVPIDAVGEQTTISYVAIVFANIQLARTSVLELLAELPREDYRRRGSLLYTLADMAAVTADAAFAKAVYDELREMVLDGSEIPQMRLLALQYLRRDLTLEDMKAIAKAHGAEQGPMRRALSDFLYEFF